MRVLCDIFCLFHTLYSNCKTSSAPVALNLSRLEDFREFKKKPRFKQRLKPTVCRTKEKRKRGPNLSSTSSPKLIRPESERVCTVESEAAKASRTWDFV